jgi:hypothetical protein
MKPIAVLSTTLLAAHCSAAELNPMLLRLISADVRMVSGADIDRQANSALKRFFLSDFNPNTDTRTADNVIWIDYRVADATKGSSTLTAIIGAIPSHEPESQDIRDRLEEFTRLDANIKVAGDPDTIREAQRRWTIDQPPSSIALKVRRLSQSYDNWFLLVKPFSVFAEMPSDVADTTAPPLKYRNDLIDAVEEISGGVRFGTINEFYLEAVFRDSEDSWAAATLARWLPGILQLKQPYSHSPAILVDAIEDLIIYAEGTRVTISLRIPEDRARSLLDAQQ